MAIKLLLDSTKILNKEFTKNKPGYNAMQVDTFLDIVIKDYDTFADYITYSEKTISDLQNQLDVLNEKMPALEAENISLKTKLGNIATNDDVSLGNLELKKRIAKLEVALKKAGINPNTI